MSRIRLILSSMLAVFAASMLASSSALAVEDACPQSGVFALCTELVAKEGPFEITSVKKAGTESLLSVPGLNGLTVLCTEASNTGIVEQKVLVSAAKLVGVLISFKGCKIDEALGVKCKLKAEEILTKDILGEIVGNLDGETQEILFDSEEGGPPTIFAVLEIQSVTGQTCPATVIGNRNVTGEQDCKLLNTEKDLADHTLECLEAGSELAEPLLVSEQQATLLLTEEILLATGKEWSLELA